MTEVLDRGASLLASWKTARPEALTALLGERPVRIALDRVHFPGRRPVQLTFSATLRSGLVATIHAEHCPIAPEDHAASVAASLRKSRNGQRKGLERSGIVTDAATGLVLRRPGLDERLPGLRLLYDPNAAREAVTALTGRDPGPVTVRLAAHRLGKRAVLRIADTSGGMVFARLRALKSGDGALRLQRHRALWQALGPGSALRIPEPLGAVPELGLSLFAALPGSAPDFGSAHCRDIARALGVLRALRPDGLPVHTGADEARLIGEWRTRCRHHLPDLADTLAPTIGPLMDRLASLESDLRPCHRDLHEKQILMADGVAGILDFDTLTKADPALDPGNLLAHLFLAGRDERPLRATLDLPRLALWRRAALVRLAMIYGFTSTPRATIRRLVREAGSDDRD